MNGIPIKIEIDGQEEEVLLSTRRTGEAGKKLKELKRKFRKLRTDAAVEAFAVQRLGKQIEACVPSEEMVLKQSAHLAKAQELADEAQETAEEIVRLSLVENYAQAADRYLDVLTDTQIIQCVEIIESGSVPADFFPSRGIRPSASAMSLSVDSASPGSSPADSGAAT